MQSFLDIVKGLAEEQRMTMAEVERKLDISTNASYKWKVSTPKGEVVNKIADLFNVSTDYLYGRSNKKNHTLESLEDLDKVLEHTMSYDGKPLTEKDKDAVRIFLQGRLSSK